MNYDTDVRSRATRVTKFRPQQRQGEPLFRFPKPHLKLQRRRSSGSVTSVSSLASNKSTVGVESDQDGALARLSPMALPDRQPSTQLTQISRPRVHFNIRPEVLFQPPTFPAPMKTPTSNMIRVEPGYANSEVSDDSTYLAPNPPKPQRLAINYAPLRSRPTIRFRDPDPNESVVDSRSSAVFSASEFEDASSYVSGSSQATTVSTDYCYEPRSSRRRSFSGTGQELYTMTSPFSQRASSRTRSKGYIRENTNTDIHVENSSSSGRTAIANERHALEMAKLEEKTNYLEEQQRTLSAELKDTMSKLLTTKLEKANIEKERSKFSDKVEALQKKNNTFHDELKHHRQIEKSYRQDSKQHADRAAQLQGDLHAVEELLTQKKLENAELHDDLKAVERLLAQEKMDNTTLQEDLQALEEALGQEKLESTTLQEDLMSVEEALAREKTENNALQASKEALQESKEALNGLKVALEERCTELEKTQELLAQEKSEMQSLQAMHSTLKVKCADLEGRDFSAGDTRKELQGVLLLQISNLESTRDALKTRLDIMEQSLADRGSELESRTASRDEFKEEAEKKSLEIEAFQAEKTQREEKFRQLEESLEELKTANQEFQSDVLSLETEKRIIADSLKSLETEKTGWITERGSLLEHIDAIETQVKDLEAEFETKQKEIDSLSGDRTRLQDENGALKSELSDKEKEMENSLNEERQEAEATISLLNSTINQLEEERAALSSDKASVASENERLSTEISSLTTENAFLTEKNATLTSEIASLTAQNATLTTEFSALNIKTATLTTENTTLTTENGTLITEKAALVSERDKLRDEMPARTDKELAENLAALEKEHEELCKERTELCAQKDALQKSNREILDERTKLQQVADSNSDQVARLQQEVQRLEPFQHHHNALADQLAGTSGQLGQITAAYATSQIEVATLQGQLAKLRSRSTPDKSGGSSGKKKGKSSKDELVIVRNSSDRGLFQVVKKSALYSSRSSSRNSRRSDEES